MDLERGVPPSQPANSYHLLILPSLNFTQKSRAATNANPASSAGWDSVSIVESIIVDSLRKTKRAKFFPTCKSPQLQFLSCLGSSVLRRSALNYPASFGHFHICIDREVCKLVYLPAGPPNLNALSLRSRA